jgi:hypothetical protein
VRWRGVSVNRHKLICQMVDRSHKSRVRRRFPKITIRQIWPKSQRSSQERKTTNTRLPAKLWSTPRPAGLRRREGRAKTPKNDQSARTTVYRRDTSRPRRKEKEPLPPTRPKYRPSRNF